MDGIYIAAGLLVAAAALGYWAMRLRARRRAKREAEFLERWPESTRAPVDGEKFDIPIMVHRRRDEP